MDNKSEQNQNNAKTPGETPNAFKLPDLMKEMKEEESWGKSGRSARTLDKTKEMRLVLNVMKAGTEIKPHQANGPISVHCIEGKIIFHTEAESVTLQKNEMLSLKEYVRHSVEAVEEAGFLLTVAPIETPE